MVGTGDGIPLLEGLGAVLGRLDERTLQTQKTTEKIASDVTAIRATQTEHRDRILSLEERSRRETRRHAVIGGASGIGGAGIVGILWGVVEAVLKGLPR